MMKRACILLTVIFVSSLSHADTSSHRKAAENILINMKLNEKMQPMTEDIVIGYKQYFEQLKVLHEWQKISQRYLNKIIELTYSELSWDKLKEDDINIWTNTFTEEELYIILDINKPSARNILLEKNPNIWQQHIELRNRKINDILPKYGDIIGELIKDLAKNMVIPKENHLRSRVFDYYSAMNDKNYTYMYAMNSPRTKDAMSFEKWKKDFRFDSTEKEPISKKYNYDLEKICNCTPWIYENGPMSVRCVLLIESTENRIEGQQLKSNFGAMWEYIDGEWFAGYPFMELEKCPSISVDKVMLGINARIIDYGIYSRSTTYTKPANNPLGHINITKDIGILTPTERVPAKIGTNFGFRFELNGQMDGIYIKYVRIIKTPRITNPDNGRTTEVFEDEISAPTGKVLFAGYTFEYEWELVPGKYTIQVYHNNRLLVEKTFDIYRP